MTVRFTKLFLSLCSALALPAIMESFLLPSGVSNLKLSRSSNSASCPVQFPWHENKETGQLLMKTVLRSSASSEEVTEESEESKSTEEQPKAKGGKGVGFGAKPKNAEKKIKKSKAALEREAAAETYEAQKKSGIPEYSIFVRELSNDDKERWLPVGSMTIPRTTKVDQALFENEENLIKGALRLFPKMDLSGGLEYGYNLKAYPDEPIRIAERSKTESNFLKSYIENAMNPLNASGLGKKDE